MRGGDKGGSNNVLKKLSAAGLSSEQIRRLGSDMAQRKKRVDNNQNKEARLRRAAGRRMNGGPSSRIRETPMGKPRGRSNYRGGANELGDWLTSNNPSSIPNRLANAGERGLRSAFSGKGGAGDYENFSRNRNRKRDVFSSLPKEEQLRILQEIRKGGRINRPKGT